RLRCGCDRHPEVAADLAPAGAEIVGVAPRVGGGETAFNSVRAWSIPSYAYMAMAAAERSKTKAVRWCGHRRPRPASSVTGLACSSARSLSVGAFGDHARELEDPGRREVLFGDPDAEVGQGILHRIGDRCRCADHAPFADASIVVGDVRRRFDVVDLDLGDLH